MGRVARVLRASGGSLCRAPPAPTKNLGALGAPAPPPAPDALFDSLAGASTDPPTTDTDWSRRRARLQVARALALLGRELDLDRAIEAHALLKDSAAMIEAAIQNLEGD